jgi:hypothetical protein
MLVLVEVGVFMLVVDLLIHSFHILAHDYLLSLCEDSLLFYKSWHKDWL